MTQPVEQQRERPSELVAGFLATAAIVVSAVALVYYPVRVAPTAVVLALVATGMARGRNRRLAALAVLASAFGWLLGMTIAIVADRPLW